MAENKETVQILMSTYNGQQYLREQLDSLIHQSYPQIEIIIRDDGSTDKTCEIIEEYVKNHDNIQLIQGQNVGVTESFFQLLKASDADFVAFCDQDDIWLSDKVERAVEQLKNLMGPAMYCSNTILVDGEGQVISANDYSYKAPSFENAVVENICTGCTVMMNRELADVIRNHLPSWAVLHDSWFYLVATYVGQVIYDKESYIQYRQHGKNEVGASKNPLKVFLAQWKYLKKNFGSARKQLEVFSQLYHGDETKDAVVRQITESNTFGKRFTEMFRIKFKRQRGLDQIVTVLLFLAHKL